MIIEEILKIAFNFMHFLINLLPSGGFFPQTVTDAVMYLSQFVHVFDFLLPIDTLFQALIFLLSIRLVIFLFHSIVWFRNMLNPMH